MRKKFGFTLAEVLITLGIIGIVAAMTIPNLMQNWEKQARITQVKAAKSILSQAFTMAVAEHGPATDWDWDDRSNFARTYIFPYLKTTSILPQDATYAQAKTMFGAFLFPYDPSGNKQNHWHIERGSYAILANGMKVYVMVNTTWADDEFDYLAARMIIDVNGDRGKTMLGNDIFIYTIQAKSGKFISDGGIMGAMRFGPEGFNTLDEMLNERYNGGCNKASVDGNAAYPGYACARLLELNGWQWPKDYIIKKW